MRPIARWALIAALLAFDLLALFSWFATALADNCDGRSGWRCSELVADAAPFAFVFGTAAVIVMVILAIGRARQR